MQRKDKHSLEEVVDTNVPTTLPETPVSELLPLVWESHVPIAVIDEEDYLQGVIARASVIAEIMGTTPEEMYSQEEEEVTDDRS